MLYLCVPPCPLVQKELQVRKVDKAAPRIPSWYDRALRLRLTLFLFRKDRNEGRQRAASRLLRRRPHAVAGLGDRRRTGSNDA